MAQLSSYRNIPIFEWLGNDESLDNKQQLNTLIRTVPPLSALGKFKYLIYLILTLKSILFDIMKKMFTYYKILQ